MQTVMPEPIPKGTWVEIHRIVLRAGERAPRSPADTQAVPLEMRVKGFLVAPATMGEEADVMTRAGRRIRGIITAVNPAYTQSFGPPIAELSSIGDEVRSRLRERRANTTAPDSKETSPASPRK
jgi:hypothetical protein